MVQWRYLRVQYQYRVARPLGGLSSGKGQYEIVVDGKTLVGMQHVEGYVNWLGSQGWELTTKAHEQWGEQVYYEMWFKQPMTA